MSINSCVYIPNIDGKDLFLYNVSNPNIGYSVKTSTGEFNYRKFIGSLDYSLDLIKLRDVYKRAYRRSDFSYKTKRKEYTNRVINVTFNYSIKEYNKYGKNVYIKFGYNPNNIKFKDNIYIKNDELIAIRTNEKTKKPINLEVVCPYFEYDGEKYVEKNIPTLYSVAEIRKELYKNGFMCDGIKYIRYKRSAGSGRLGKCLFIDENLYSRIHKWEMCGLTIKENDEVDLAALESYISLTLSSIIDTISIKPENILVIDDYESVFKEKVMATEYVEGRKSNLSTKEKEIEIHNSIWDGQSLMDSSLFKGYEQYGSLLLRYKFFKSCTFNCNIQQFFKDNNITEISQLNGSTRAKDIKDVKLITTPSSIKYLKFGSLDKWLDNIDSDFGIVKHEKPTHYFDGRMVLTHYQLLNTLQLSKEDIEQLLKPSLDYLSLIHTKPSVLRHHIKYKNDEFEIKPLKSKNDIIYALMGLNNKFTKTKLYCDFKRDLTKAYTKKLRHGKILVNGNYSVLCGNPYEMLLCSIGKFNGESNIGVGNIYSKRFDWDKTILGSRSPHICAGNVWIAKNKYNKYIDNYLNTTNEIVCVNSINENLLERLSGSDFDSDIVLLTDNNILVKAAQKNYYNFLTPTNLVTGNKIKRKYNNDDKSSLDIKTSVNKIGEIVNLSQELNSVMWDMINNNNFSKIQEIYKDISQLAVMSGCEIDSAKKELPIDNAKELEYIRNKYSLKSQDGRKIKPNFFSYVARNKGFYDNVKNEYKMHKTSMDYIQNVINKFRLPYQKTNFIKLSELLDNSDTMRANNEQIKKVLRIVTDCKNNINKIWASPYLNNNEKHLISEDIKSECVSLIENIRFNQNTIIKLLKIVESEEYKNISKTLVSMLFSIPNDSFFNAFIISKENIPILTEDVNGSIEIFDFKYNEENTNK